MRKLPLLVLAGAAFVGNAAHAALFSGGDLHPVRQAQLERAPAWQSFRARYGAWNAEWNESAGSPHLAVGPAIALAGFQNDRAGVDQAVRGFLAEHRELFGTPALELLRASKAGSVWYVGYRRTLRGLPVLGEDWEFRVGSGGTLMAFGVDAHPAPARLPLPARLPAAVLEAATRAALGLGAGAKVTLGDAGWLPWETAEGLSYRVVNAVEARVASPPAAWVAYVDAGTGEVLWRHDRVRHIVSGHVTASVHLGLPSEPQSVRALPHLFVTSGSNAAQTDAAGGYVLPSFGPATVSSEILGAFCDVSRFDDQPDASFTQSISTPATLDIAWTDANSQDAERDAYYHLNLAHDWIQSIDPGFSALDYVLPVAVDYPGFCNAIWDGIGITFFGAGGGCPNTATLPDAVYHEYGHAMCDRFYVQLGQSFGMLNGALHDGLSDALSCFLRDDPVVGRDFFGPGTTLRTLENHAEWPQDHSPVSQEAGLILGGALWDLRQSLGLPLASRLAHYALYGKPDSGNDGDAMAAFFLDMLLADDDDGNLANGTPHSAAIVAAFNAHGIGTGHFLRVQQEDPEDHPVPGPYPVLATVTSTSPIGSLTHVALAYSVNGGPYAEIPMESVGGDDYWAAIPAPQGSIVRYYVRATDSFGASHTDPIFELERTKLFLAGPVSKVVNQEAELPFGWTIGAEDDNATSGIWVWGEPNGTVVPFNQQCQPEADHSPTGIMCFFTGQASVGQGPGANDVDNGTTTLFTDVLDVSAAGSNPVVEYYRWFSNDLGGEVDDHWRTSITGDLGVTWVPIEDTMMSDNSWRRVAFLLHDYVAAAPEGIMLRFTAEDVGQPSLVEAAVDDVHVWRFDAGATGVAEPEAALALAAAPNPFTEDARVAFTLPRAGPASVTVLDVQGRRVRSLRSGTLPAGSQSARWDGRDEAGRRVASGLYFVRLEAGGARLVRRLVRAR